jgi:hypothetical protein
MTKPESPRRKKARGLLLRHGYAVGGHVKQAIAEAVHAHERHDHKGRTLTKLKRGGAAEGAEPAARADKPRRAAFDKRSGGGRNKKAGTKVIIVNAGHAPPQPVPVPVPRPVPVPSGAAPAARPMPGPSQGMPAAPIPGAPPGGRPPMAKRGGRIKEPAVRQARPRGGVGMTVGSKNALGRLQKMRAYGHH